MNIENFLMLLLVHLTGQFIISYKGFAEKYGYPIGLLFDMNKINIVNILGIIFYITPLALCYRYNPWWTIPLCLLLGILIGALITQKLRSKTQIVALCMLPIALCMLGYVIYVNDFVR